MGNYTAADLKCFGQKGTLGVYSTQLRSVYQGKLSPTKKLKSFQKG